MEWIKANRLKAVSVLAVAADIFMALAGVSALSFSGAAGLFLLIAGCLGLSGHLVLFLWGRGARLKNIVTQITQSPLPIIFKPFVPWHYPLDSAFFLWVIGGIFYTLGGAFMHNTPLLWNGLLVIVAASMGWLWPQAKLIFGFRSVQVTAILYFLATISTIWAAILAQSLFIFLAGIAYGFCNAILFTVRKENQSTYTQTHES